MVVRKLIELRGIVQGVGFRPHVVRQALAHGIAGLCGNSDEEVFIEAQGEEADVEAFGEDLVTLAPPLAMIDSVKVTPMAPDARTQEFVIVASRASHGERTLLPADGACCEQCLAEMGTPGDRRYQYPFITCTNCGPRLSIITDLPYDRPQTTLAPFPLCDQCRAEYSDPDDRRFHAQPIGCFDCGPRIWLTDANGKALAGREPQPGESGQNPGDAAQVITAAQQLLRMGKIIAVKGLGGYTLMVDATNREAVNRLRARKARPAKPLALMCPDLSTAQTLADFSGAALDELCSLRRPIVLAPVRPGTNLAPGVSEVSDQVGIMLPSAPVHFLLGADLPPLVATSANASGEPLYSDNVEAVAGLGAVADAFLLNNRDIYHPIEDSVLTQTNDGSLQMVRRSRGYVPLGTTLPTSSDYCVLGIGAELKNSLALTRGGRAFMGPHLGDMKMLRSRGLLEAIVPHWEKLHRRTPQLVVADRHPDYHSRIWAASCAASREVPYLEIQHHHAHALSLLVEHGMRGEHCVIATIDGTGWGSDQSIWGGEFFSFEGNDLQPVRVDSLPRYRLVGGDSAAHHPWRIARALLKDWDIDAANLTYLAPISPARVALVDDLLATETATISTTSMGRLFDAVSVLCGLGTSITFDAEGPIRLEALAGKHRSTADSGSVTETEPTNPQAAVARVVASLVDGKSPATVAWNFHRDIAVWIADTLVKHARGIGTDTVGLSGGSAVNRLLDEMVRTRVQASGMNCLVHRKVPAGDGAIGLGQAWAGHLWLEEGGEIDVLCDSRADPLAVGRP